MVPDKCERDVKISGELTENVTGLWWNLYRSRENRVTGAREFTVKLSKSRVWCIFKVLKKPEKAHRKRFKH